MQSDASPGFALTTGSFGQAIGTDVTLLTAGKTTEEALRATAALQKKGVSINEADLAEARLEDVATRSVEQLEAL